MKYVWLVIAGLSLVFGLMMAYSYGRLKARLRVHVPADVQTPLDYGLYPAPVKLAVSGRKLAGWYFEAQNPKGGVVLVHGLGWPRGGKAHMLAHAKYLYDAGFSSLAIDLYSFGESEGERISLGAQEWQDVKAGYDYLRGQEGLMGKKVGFLGVSMGGASCLIAAGKAGVGDFVIASVPYATADGLVKQQIRREERPVWLFWPATNLALRSLVTEKCDAFDYVEQIKVPVLYLEGMYDETIPKGDVQLLKAGTSQAELVTFEAGHDIRPEKPEEFERVVLSFLEKVANDNN